MNLSVLTATLHEEIWNVTDERQAHTTYAKEAALFVMPIPIDDVLPDGTTNAVLTYLYQRAQPQHWLTSIASLETITIIFEKSPTALWARVELPGLLLITRGCTASCIAERLRYLMAELAASHERSIETLDFQYVYDISTVCELIQAFKPGQMAEQTGIDLQLLSRIMTGVAHPCIQQTKQLETSLRRLGKQLMQLSLQ